MHVFSYESEEYVDTKDIIEDIKAYRKINPKSRKYKSVRSKKDLVEQYGLYHIFGKIIDNTLVITPTYSMKTGSIFIKKNDYDKVFGEKPEVLPEAPPLLEDEDLYFFVDEDGKEYKVEMRGTRAKESIFFKVKDIMNVFEINDLHRTILREHTTYKNGSDYLFFTMSNVDDVSNKQNKELYLTYKGLMRVIYISRSGVIQKFKKWIDEIVFSANWGTSNQKITTFKKVLNVDADHLKHIMNKSSSTLSCLYLIDIQKNCNSKKIYKYGFTDNIKRRFNEHIKIYGDSIKLDQFILIPALDLSKAETDFKNSVSRYGYVDGPNTELISLCEESYINIKNIFRTISDKYCGNLRNQINYYEREIMELKHTINLKDKEIELKDKELEIKDKEIENLSLKLKICSLQNNPVFI